jgi:hypothetical protein
MPPSSALPLPLPPHPIPAYPLLNPPSPQLPLFHRDTLGSALVAAKALGRLTGLVPQVVVVVGVAVAGLVGF